MLIAIGIRAVLRHDVRAEAEPLERAHGVPLQIGDQHGVEMTQPVFATDGDEVIDRELSCRRTLFTGYK